MGGLFRSEDMQFVQINMTTEIAQATVNELGKFGMFHMIDLNSDDVANTENFLYYKKRVVACQFWERKLAWFEKEMERNDVDAPGPEVEPKEYRGGDAIAAVKDYLTPLEIELNRNIEFKNAETRTLNELAERAVVLRTLKPQILSPMDVPGSQQEDSGSPRPGRDHMELQSFERQSRSGSHELKQPFLANAYDIEYGESKVGGRRVSGSRFHNYITGIIPVAQQGLFERMLFRVSRGNAYVRYTLLDHPVMDPAANESTDKSVFYVVYIGQQLERRIAKICELFRATRYELPTEAAEIDRELLALANAQVEKQVVLEKTQSDIVDLLNRLAFEGPNHMESPMRNWQEALRREKLIADAMKKCHTPENSNIVTARGWVPRDKVDALKLAVRMATASGAGAAYGAQPAIVEEFEVDVAPPTYFRTNKFTGVFQGIVNTYGVPRYKEVNPGLFTIATFPFLFGIMYGDMFHGTCLFFFSLWMILNEKSLLVKAKRKQLNEMFAIAFGGRYLLIFMGACAVYCGTIYNDLASIPVDAFGTHWFYPTSGPNYEICQSKNTTLDCNANWDGGVYPYGVDPGWYNTKNELTFFNSMKMKISVTFGVIHMVFGIVLGLFNHTYFHDQISIWFEWLPQLLFMLCTFGYMIFLIIYKFTLQSDHLPNLIQTMIKMVLSPGTVASEDQIYPGQGIVQAVLIVVAVLCIPWMLFPKPYILKARALKQNAHAHSPPSSHQSVGMEEPRIDDEKDDDPLVHGEKSAASSKRKLLAGVGVGTQGGGGGHGEHGGEFNFSEIFIHQCIHTIEFVLGAVSNTASYLRLWALSLAHAELSNVFWEKLIVEYGINKGQVFGFIGFGAWAGATFAVLLSMDVLECFLHALRLHWVEFQNKFFKADGYAFKPFDFAAEEDD